MSWQDFALGVLASLFAAIICGILKYVRHIRFLALVKLDRCSLVRKPFLSPIILSIVLYMPLIIFTPSIVNRDEEFKTFTTHKNEGHNVELYSTADGVVSVEYTSYGPGRGSVNVSATNNDGTLIGRRHYPLKYR
jgi:hypothetical protein